MFDRILVPTDGSAPATAAVEVGVALARRFEADLHALNVLDTGSLPPGVTVADPERFAGRDESVTRAVETAADAGVGATASLVDRDEGESVHEAILEYAGEHDVDGIVVGTHGRTGLDRYLLGSVTERTLRESPVPVVAVHEQTVVDARLDVDHVLVPTDGSEGASAAVRRAIDLALVTDAALHAVHVVDLGAVWDDPSGGMVVETLEEGGSEAVEAVAERARTAGVGAIETDVLHGTPHREILDYTGENDIDWVVMGTHGRTGLDRYLLGSVTERVVRLADVPVLATRKSSD